MMPPANRDPVFTVSDVWVLLAIAFASSSAGGAKLKDIIAAGDGVQRVILSGAELRRAFSKLIHSGHIAEEGGAFRLAGAALNLWRAHSDQRRSNRWWRDAFERLLKPDPNHRPSNPSDDDPLWPYDKITDEDVRVASEQYRREFWAAYKASRDKG